ncbi:MAG: AhpC/TSA family protein [Verrucomicrobia bacterium]|nr:AhpC/TSA family protein [Cytophagales bacterium]
MKNISKIIAICLFISLTAFKNDEPTGLKTGEKAPDFTAKDYKGQEVSLKKILKKNTVVLVFYRGQWCPFCNKQLKNIQDSLTMITKKGAIVLAVSPEMNENIAKTIQKTKASFTVVHDENASIMKNYKTAYTVDAETVQKYKGYGVDFDQVNGENKNVLPVPAVYVIGKDQMIKFSHFDPDYSKRASVAAILKSI